MSPRLPLKRCVLRRFLLNPQPDLRDPSTTLLNFTRSINLALSERGINALKNSGHGGILSHVFGATIPMRGRMIHGRRPSGELYEEPQDYDAHGRVSGLATCGDYIPFGQVPVDSMLDHLRH